MNHEGRKVLAVAASEEKVFLVDAASGKLLGQASLGRGSGTYGSIAVDPSQSAFYVLSLRSRVHEFRIKL